MLSRLASNDRSPSLRKQRVGIFGPKPELRRMCTAAGSFQSARGELSKWTGSLRFDAGGEIDLAEAGIEEVHPGIASGKGISVCVVDV